jgi:flagellar biosynthesis/type III secretory pathway chaperone
MRTYMKVMGSYGSLGDNRPAEASFAADDVSLIEIAREEHAALESLVDILKREREAILALSLKDITETNREKETVLRTLATLRKRRGGRPGNAPDSGLEQGYAEYLTLTGTIKAGMREAQRHIRRNGVLLSLSAGRIRSVMEFVARSLKARPVTYGRESKQGPMLLARRV